MRALIFSALMFLPAVALADDAGTADMTVVAKADMTTATPGTNDDGCSAAPGRTSTNLGGLVLTGSLLLGSLALRRKRA